MMDKKTYTITTSDGRSHQVSEENIEKYGMPSYADAYKGATIRMRNKDGADYDIPLGNYDDARRQGLQPFRTEHTADADDAGVPKVTDPQKTSVSQATEPQDTTTGMRNDTGTVADRLPTGEEKQAAEATDAATPATEASGKDADIAGTAAALGAQLETRSRSRLEDILGIGKGTDYRPSAIATGADRERTYPTPSGKPYTEDALGDAVRYRQRQAADMTLGAQMRRAQERMRELEQAALKRRREIHTEIYGQDGARPGPFAVQGMASAEGAMLRGDQELGTIEIAMKETADLIARLERQKARDAGRSVGFWRGTWDTLSDPGTWDFGLGALKDAAVMVRASANVNASEAEKEAFGKMLEARYLNEEAQGRYPDTRMYRWGGMTAEMVPFMMDFALTGGGFAGIEAGARAGGKATAKALGEKAVREIAEQGFKTYVRNYGMEGAGRYAVDRTVKALGTTADDLVRATLMTNTIRGARTAADIIDRKLGDVTADGNGNYHFMNDKTWGSAIWQSEANDIIENFSEMFGAHLPEAASMKNLGRLAGVLGAKRLSGVLSRAGADALGTVSEATRRIFRQMGVSGYLGEVSEEYYGQLWRTMLGLDDAYRQNDDGTRTNLFRAKEFHGDIWGGMALSMGVLGAGKATLAGAGYASMKHRVNKADARANELLGREVWEPMKAMLDNTVNEDAGRAMETIVNSAEFTPVEKAALLEYAERSLNMRGFNLATLAHSRGDGQDEDARSMDASYIDGYNIATPQEMADARNMLEYQRRRMAEVVGADAQTLEAGGVDWLHEARNARNSGTGQGERRAQAIIDWLNARQVYDGMMQRVRDDIDGRIAQSDAQTDARTHRTTGMVTGATMKQDDRRVYVIDGNPVQYEDGSGIDIHASDTSIIVRDAETGKLEQVSPEAILNIDEPQDPAELKAATAEAIREQSAKEAADRIGGIATFNAGDTYTIAGEDGQQAQVQIVADEQGAVDNGDGTVNVSDGTTVFPMPKEVIQQAADAASAARVADFERRRAEENAVAEQAAWEAHRPRYAVNDRVTMRDADGNVIHGEIAEHDKADDRFVVEADAPIGGRYVVNMPREQLDGMVVEHNGTPVRKPATSATSATADATSETDAATTPTTPATDDATLLTEPTSEMQQSDTEGAATATDVADSATTSTTPTTTSTEPATDVATPATDAAAPATTSTTPATPALDRMPKDGQGNPVYEQAETPDLAWDAIVELTEGDEGMAQNVADGMVADKEAALKKLEKARPKGGSTVAEKIAAEKERKAAVDAASRELDIWKQIAGTANRRKTAEAAERRRKTEEDSGRSGNSRVSGAVTIDIAPKKENHGRNRKEVYSRHTTTKQPAETVGASQKAEQNGTQASSSMNAPTTSSEGNVVWRTPKDATTVSAEQQGLDYVHPLEAEDATKGSELTPQAKSSKSKDSASPSEKQENATEISEDTSRTEEKNTKVPPHLLPKKLLEAYESGDAATIAEAEKAMRDFVEGSEDHRRIAGTYFGAKDQSRKFKDKGSPEYKRVAFIAETCKDVLVKVGIPKQAFMSAKARRDLAAETDSPDVLDVLSADSDNEVNRIVIGNPNTRDATLRHLWEKYGAYGLGYDAEQALKQRGTHGGADEKVTALYKEEKGVKQQQERESDLSEEVSRVDSDERVAMQSRIVDWLSEKNLSLAFGKTREKIFDEFGNELMPIACIPTKYMAFVEPGIKDPRIYCGKGYFIDHALRNHGNADTQIPVENVDVSKYLNIQTVLDSPDSIKETTVDGKRTVVFIKKIGRYFAELAQVEDKGRIVLHKSLFNQKKEPYAKLNDIRSEKSSPEGGVSSISHADNAAPAISLQSRDDAVSQETVAKTEPQQPTNAESSDSSLSERGRGGIQLSEPNGESTASSASEDSASPSEKQENATEISGKTSEQEENVSAETDVPTSFKYFTGTLAELISLAKQSAKGLVKKIIAPISSRLKADLNSRGLDVNEAYKHVIDNNAIRHTLNRHSGQNEEERGQIPIIDADFENIADIVDNYDGVEVVPGSKPAQRIIYHKAYPDGTVVFVEEQRTGRKELAAVTMWKKKNPNLTDANRNKPTQISDLTGISTDKDSKKPGKTSGTKKKAEPVSPRVLREAYELNDAARIAEAERAMRDFIESFDGENDKYQHWATYLHSKPLAKADIGETGNKVHSFIAETCKDVMMKRYGVPKQVFGSAKTQLKLAKSETTDPGVLDLLARMHDFEVNNAVINNPNTSEETLRLLKEYGRYSVEIEAEKALERRGLKPQRIGENAPVTREEKALRDAIVDRLRESGIEVITDTESGQRVLDEANGKGERVRTQAMLNGLNKASDFIRSVLSGKTKQRRAKIEIPERANRLAEEAIKHPIKSHSINANEIAHIKNRHGEKGTANNSNSIPLRDEDISLMPYIMAAPTRVIKGSTAVNGTESVRYEKDLGSGYVVVVEREGRFDVEDMENITMWAEKKPATNVTVATKTSHSTSKTIVISEADAAKIRKDAEDAIRNDGKIREHRVFHGSGADFEAFDHSHMGEGEGAQAYGYGSYVTEVEGIGRSYAGQRRGKISYKGKSVSEVIDLYNKKVSPYNTVLSIITKMENGFTFAEAKEAQEAEWRSDLSYEMEEGNGKYAEGLEKSLSELAALKEEDFHENNERHLYTVEIPDDTGSNYLDWEKPLPEIIDKAEMAEMLLKQVTNGVTDETETEMLDRDIRDSFREANTGRELYKAISMYIGDKAASEFLSSLGFTGIRYPAQATTGGRKDGARNYVIFKESDMKITDHVRFFKTKDGEVYGFTVGGKIYLDPRVANADTPIHEYTHLWADALRQANPKEWKNVVELMKGTPAWEEVKRAYPELKTDDEIADEVLATYSGKRGAERLRKEQRKMTERNASAFGKAEAISALERVKEALRKFWKNVADLLHIHFTTAEEVADKVLSDLLEGVNPTTTEDDDIRFRESRDERSLIAVHNLSEDKLKQALDLGGFPMPSIAVTRADVGHTTFGDISLVFSRESIDPTDRRNKVYGEDAWTPVFPSVGYKLNEKKTSDIYGRANKAGSLPLFNPAHLHPDNLERHIDGLDSKGLVDRFKDDYGAKQFYLSETGNAVREFEQHEVEKYPAESIGLYEKVLEEIGLERLKNEDYDTLEEEMKRIIGQYRGVDLDGITPFRSRALIKNTIRQATDYAENGNRKTEADIEATKRTIDERTDPKKFEVWLEDLFAGVVEKKGIRNDKDPFTPSGNSRKWEDLYDQITLDNVVKAMQQQAARGGQGLFGGSIFGAAQEEYKSIDAVREAARERIRTMDESDYKAQREAITDRLSDIKIPGVGESFSDTMDMVQNIQDAVARSHTPNGIHKYLKEFYPKVTMETADKIADIVKDIQRMSARYFEAKPYRAVGFDEVRLAVVPSDTDANLVSELERHGIPVRRYERGNEAERRQIVEEATREVDLRFRDSDALTEEERFIIDQAEANGTYMKAPNGKPTNLTERQWVQVRTKAFKEWFGDWEKTARVEKLRRSRPVEVSGDEYKGKYELNSKSAGEYIITSLRGEYTNADTNTAIRISRKAQKVTHHDAENDIHLKSIAYIPQMVENAIYIDEAPNEKDVTGFDSYKYYAVGLNIGGVDYTARLTVGVKNGEAYYDHALTQIEKSDLINQRDLVKAQVYGDEAAYSDVKDKRLISLLQTNSSKIVDENGEPLASDVEDFKESGADNAGTEGRVQELARKLHVKVRVIDSADEVTNVDARRAIEGGRRIKGWFDPATEQITVWLPGNAGVADAVQTVLHEAVAHYGLRRLFGEHFDAFLDDVYANADAEVKRRIDGMKGRYGGDTRTATEEYLATLAERTDFENTSPGWWQKIKDFFLDMLRKAGIDLRTYDDNALRYILWRSYENLRGDTGVFAEAADSAMRYELKVGEYAARETEESKAGENGDAAGHADNGGNGNAVPESIREANERFNEELSGLTEANADNTILSLGRPSAVLRAAGVEDKPMKLYGNKVIKKMKKHGFTLDELRNLPNAVADPIAVFDNYGKEGNRSILTELRTEQGNFLVTIDLGKGEMDTDFNVVTSVFGKGDNNVVNWINKGFATYVNKEKALNYLHHSAPIAEALSSPRLISATKIVEKFENPNIGEENAGGVLFREGDPEMRERALARDRYERRVKSGMYQTREAMQDSMQSVKEAMDAILGRKTYVEDVEGFENAYLGENRLSSVNQAEADAFGRLLFKPMLDEVAGLARNEAEREELTDYMMAKHGLERNKVMAERDAQEAFDKNSKAHPTSQKTLQDFIDKYRQKDYAGLTALIGTDNAADAEAEAQRMVADYEAAHDTSALWRRVNAVNRAILQKSFECGMMSRETFDKVSGMYGHYIPLRGFDEKTSSEAYAYLTHGESAFNAPIKAAKGRKSKADDPFANMQAMAESAIMQGNRNVLVKQRFLNFVLNHPSDLVGVSDLWLQYDAVADEWTPVFPEGIGTTDTPGEVERKMQDFETRMEALAADEPDRYRRGRDAADIPYRVVASRDLREHQVIVKRGGRDIVLTVNGNPRLAQALNGQTNPDNLQTGIADAVFRAGESINRHLSAFYTTRNPDFILSNFMRDMLYTNTMVWVKESPNYALRFHRHCLAEANPAHMKILLAKYRKGTLDMGDKTEALFHHFMMNGGETGYANVRDIEKHKNDIRRELKKANGRIPVQRAWDLLGERFDEVNRAIENAARFAAFMTSREIGRSIDRAIYDAKEISVNFNKKGSGAKFFRAQGQTTAGNVGAFVSGAGRAGFVFWNAAIQGTANIGRQVKRHPAKALTGMASMFLLGALVASIGGDDDDDGKSSYYNLPEYVRRSNILFRAGGHWISIPLPVEYRAVYGLGELAASTLGGKEHLTGGELAEAIAGQVSQCLPVDFMEGGGGMKAFIPSAVKPWAEAYVIEKGWTGMPLYKGAGNEDAWNRNMPEWTKAYSSANKYIVGLAAALNEATGGDRYTKGAVDINPAKVEYMLNGYFGGVAGTIDKMAKMAETIAGEREYDPRSFLLLNRVLKAGDERTAYRAVNNEYFRLKEEHDELKRRLRNYENDTGKGIFDYAEKINFLYNSPEYRRYEIFEKYRKDIETLDKALKEARERDPYGEDAKSIGAYLNEVKSAMIEEMQETRRSKQLNDDDSSAALYSGSEKSKNKAI